MSEMTESTAKIMFAVAIIGMIAAVIQAYAKWLELQAARIKRDEVQSRQASTGAPKPRINHARAEDQLLARDITFWGYLKRSWVRILIQWTGNFTAIFLMVWQYRSTAPLTRPSVVLIALIASLWVYFSIMFFFIDERISN